MSRKTVRWILVGLLFVSAGFAGWSWLRPYEWSADSAAGCHIKGCQVVKDHANYWVNLQLKVNGDMEHNLEIPARLLTEAGRMVDAADITLVGDEAKPVRQIWLKFWLEKEDMNGSLKLRINEGELSVRSGSGEPVLRDDGTCFHVTDAW